jgi:hypothetical protein
MVGAAAVVHRFGRGSRAQGARGHRAVAQPRLTLTRGITARTGCSETPPALRRPSLLNNPATSGPRACQR